MEAASRSQRTRPGHHDDFVLSGEQEARVNAHNPGVRLPVRHTRIARCLPRDAKKAAGEYRFRHLHSTPRPAGAPAAPIQVPAVPVPATTPLRQYRRAELRNPILSGPPHDSTEAEPASARGTTSSSDARTGTCGACAHAGSALGAILSSEERKKLDVSIRRICARPTDSQLESAGERLTPSQNDSVDRARAFIDQAAQYHDRDLATAAELARRARVLTQDLAGAR